MIKAAQLRDLIIVPTLKDLNQYSESAVELLLFTCAVESDGGKYLKQIEGPALGIYQMEPATYNDIWQNYIKTRTELLLILLSSFSVYSMPDEDRLIYDLRFATVMARLHYSRIPLKLPEPSDTIGLWEYYKVHYNTLHGSATKLTSIQKYSDFIKQ